MAAINEVNSSTEGKWLEGKTALVTGSSRGIGKAIAIRLAALGAAVGLCGRNAEALKSSEAELRRSGGRVYARLADVTRSADVQSLVESVETELGPIGILVNNAG